MTLTIWKSATAFAGNDGTLCNGTTFQVLDASATNYATLAWTENGTGSLDDANILTPTYTPLASETGTVKLVLTVTPQGGSVCPVAKDSMYITITNVPTVSAGADDEICSTENYDLTGTSNTTVLWTTSGSGTFTAPTSATTTYTPSLADINDGQVVLTLTTTQTGHEESCLNLRGPSRKAKYS